MGDVFRSNSSRLELVGIYRNWERANFYLHAKYLTLALTFVMSLLIPFDLAIFGYPNPFTEVRYFAVGLFLSNFIFINVVGKRDKVSLSKLCLIAPPLIFTFIYEYYQFFTHHEYENLVFISNIMTIFFLTFALHKFSSLQHLYTLVSIVSLGFVSQAISKNFQMIFFLLIAHICSSLTATYFRREFVGTLHERFLGLKNLVPIRLAKSLIVSNNSNELYEIFKPMNRKVVCLCADWRGFQEMSAHMKPQEVTKLIETYYETVITTLGKIDKTENNYLSWVADELFIIFFDELENTERMKATALEFAYELANNVVPAVKKETNVELKLDIGISFGEGLLGLQGPRSAKKTTISGAVAGKAKRYETEAKTIRASMGLVDRPIIVMDEALYKFANEMPTYQKGEFLDRKAETKDIDREKVYVWFLDRRLIKRVA